MFRQPGRRTTVLVVLAAAMLATACSSGTSPLASSAPTTTVPVTTVPTTVPPTTPATVAPTTTVPPTTVPARRSPSVSLTQRSPLVKKAVADGIKKGWFEVTGTYHNRTAVTRIETLSGPDAGYQSISEGTGHCRFIVLDQTVYVSCNPVGGELLVGWTLVGAEQVGTRWIAYTSKDSAYDELSTAITTSSDLESLAANGSIGFSASSAGAATTHVAGGTTTVTAPLTVGLLGKTVRGTETVTITGSSDPLITAVKVSVPTVSGAVTLGGWGSSTLWKKEVQKPAGAIPFSRYAGVLTPSTAT